MSKILFHPQITAGEAMAIVAGQGGRLVYRGTRQRLEQALREVDRSAVLFEAGDYNGALDSLRAARMELS